jgi:phosphoglycolate phosphatase
MAIRIKNPGPGTRNPGPVLLAFDLDGVIYSSEPFIAESYRESIKLVNEKRPGSFARVPSTREILDHVGWPVAVILERLFPNVERVAVDLLFATTLEVICDFVRRGQGEIYPGIAPTLRELAARGYTLAVASNGRRPYIEAVLSTYELMAFFAPIVSADEVGDKAAVLRAYLDRHQVNASDAIMIGDRSSDVEAARAVGTRFIGCDYGHGYRNEIEGAGPIVDRFDALPDVVARIAAR